ncbi:DUF3613 domain-containing protein [Alicycliphilus sp. T452]|jgi:hypothetical protein
MPLRTLLPRTAPLCLAASLLAALACASAQAADEAATALPNRSVAAVQASTPAGPQLPPAAPAPQALPEPAPMAAAGVQPVPLPLRSLDMGRATEQLLAQQRSTPGVRPRPIDGEQAGRSWQRYLKSFETPIPAKYETGMDTGTR